MTGSLFPVLQSAPIDSAPQAPQEMVGTGYSWDFELGQFVVDGNGRIVELDAKSAFLQWCILSLLIQRNVYTVYSDQFGIEKDRVIGSAANATEAEAEMVITDALTNSDKRVYSVGGFTFARVGSALEATFTIIPVEGEPQTLSVSIGV